MSRIIWTAASTRDLAAMQAYLEQFDSRIAQDALERVISATTFLLDHPFAGPAIDYRDWRKWKPKRLRYVLTYRPVRNGVEVVRVRHERNDWKPVPE